MKFFLLLCLLLPVLPFSACSALEDNAANQLSHTKNAIAESKKRQKEIEEEQKKTERELKSLQQEMVNIARKTGEKEEDLSAFEDKLAILQEQKKNRQNALNARQSELSAIISAMISLKKLPPEAIIAMPGKIEETTAAARALAIITGVIEEESTALAAQLAQLDELENKIRKNQENIARGSSDLQEKQAGLAQKIKERTRLQNELGSKDRKEREKLAQLNQKSRSLQELIEALNLQNRQEKEEKQNNTPPKSAPDRKEEEDEQEFTPFGNGAKLHLPASGKIIQRYGNGSDNEFSHGITIKTREKASVIAPFAGEVVYAGNFRDYGKMVILRHGNDYHTLLSGMESINCTPGQLLVKGEPIGIMGKAEESTRLYLELRRNSKPVNPEPFLHRK